MAGLGAPARGAAGDSNRGLAVAARWCSECHAVTPAQARGQRTATEVPSFMSIARSGRSADALRGFLSTPHATMPAASSLSRQEIEDVVSYFRSLAAER